MSKLFKVKEWLTVVDAAKHLAIVFGEDVTESDVLRFALDGALKLSVNFVNGATGRVGLLVPIKEATYEEAVFPLCKEPIRLYGGPVISTNGVESHILMLEREPVTLRGVYDLPMIGGERLEVEHRYQRLTGGPDVTLVPMDGAFIEIGGGQLCQLLDDYEDNEYCAGSTGSLERLKRLIRVKEVDAGEAEKMLNQHKDDRIRFLEDRKTKPRKEHFYPSGRLPEDIVFVVRTDVLTDFVQSVKEETANSEKQLGTKEKDTLLKLVIGMAIKGYSHDPSASKNNTAKEIADDLAELGVSVSDDTVRKYLKLAAEFIPSVKRI